MSRAAARRAAPTCSTTGWSATPGREAGDPLGRVHLDDRAVEEQTGIQVLVSGNTAVGIDITENLARALPVFLVVVVGLSFLLLTLAFRSLLVPLKATLGFLLSVGPPSAPSPC